MAWWSQVRGGCRRLQEGTGSKKSPPYSYGGFYPTAEFRLPWESLGRLDCLAQPSNATVLNRGLATHTSDCSHATGALCRLKSSEPMTLALIDFFLSLEAYMAGKLFHPESGAREEVVTQQLFVS
jgi:hypothetical protein